MTGGSLPKNIIRFTVPIMLMAMLQILFIACDDMLILGIFAGSKALAAVGATTYLVNLFVNAFLGISIGVNVLTAQSVGADNTKKTQNIVHTAMASSLLFGVLLLILGVSFSRLCLEAMKTPEDIINQSAVYLRIYFLSTPATLVFNFGAAVLRAEGDSKHPFIYLTIAGFSDIILNTFFVVVCHLGVAGTAIGTLISQMTAAALIVRRLMNDSTACRLYPRKLKIQRDAFFSILKLGIPAGLNNMAFSFSNMQIQSSINLFGSQAVAGCSASATVEGFVYAATNSVMQAAISFTGQNVGAGKADNVPKVLKWCLIYASIIGTTLGGLVYLSGNALFPIFIDDEDVVYAMIRSGVILLPYMFCGIMETLAGTLRGLGKSLEPTLVTLTGACIFRVVWVHTVFRAAMSLEVLFLSYPISWILTAAAHFVCYRAAMNNLKGKA